MSLRPRGGKARASNAKTAGLKSSSPVATSSGACNARTGRPNTRKAADRPLCRHHLAGASTSRCRECVRNAAGLSAPARCKAGQAGEEAALTSESNRKAGVRGLARPPSGRSATGRGCLTTVLKPCGAALVVHPRPKAALNGLVPVRDLKLAAPRSDPHSIATVAKHHQTKQPTTNERKNMNHGSKVLITALALGMSAWVTTAQDASSPTRRGDRPGPREGSRPGGPGGEGQRPPMSPIMAALDANSDGVIDEKEIANASAALKKLDKNGDGKLTGDEIRPQFRGAPGGPGGGEGRGPGDRPQRGAGERQRRPGNQQ